MKNNLTVAAVTCAVLMGCKANDDSLPDYIAEVTRSARKELVTPPPIIPFQAFIYSRDDVREPFELPKEAMNQNQLKVREDCWQPAYRANKSSIERFSLSQLKFKGVMSQENKTSALIMTPEGQLAYVTKGQYIGRNHGRITEINKQYLGIQETFPDGLGCWNQRNVKLALK